MQESYQNNEFWPKLNKMHVLFGKMHVLLKLSDNTTQNVNIHIHSIWISLCWTRLWHPKNEPTIYVYKWNKCALSGGSHNSQHSHSPVVAGSAYHIWYIVLLNNQRMNNALLGGCNKVDHVLTTLVMLLLGYFPWPDALECFAGMQKWSIMHLGGIHATQRITVLCVQVSSLLRRSETGILRACYGCHARISCVMTHVRCIIEWTRRACDCNLCGVACFLTVLKTSFLIESACVTRFSCSLIPRPRR